MFGRVELVIIAIVFYVIGTIVEATSNNVSSFAAGAVLYQVCPAQYPHDRHS